MRHPRGLSSVISRENYPIISINLAEPYSARNPFRFSFARANRDSSRENFIARSHSAPNVFRRNGTFHDIDLIADSRAGKCVNASAYLFKTTSETGLTTMKNRTRGVVKSHLSPRPCPPDKVTPGAASAAVPKHTDDVIKRPSPRQLAPDRGRVGGGP